MARPLPFIRVSSGLSPDSQSAWEALKRFKEGDSVSVEIKKLRSPEQLRLWWAQIDTAFENFPEELQRHYGDEQGLHAAVLCHLGYCTEIRRKHPDGSETIIQRPHSIALGNMDQETFGTLLDKQTKLLEETLGVPPGSLRREAAEPTNILSAG